MKLYQEIEPIPEVPAFMKGTWLLAGSWLFGCGLSFLTPVTHSWWWFAAYAPFAVLLPRSVIRTIVLSRRFDRDMDGWDERMHAHYENLSSQREKGMWS